LKLKDEHTVTSRRIAYLSTRVFAAIPYYFAINWDILASETDYTGMIAAMQVLKNQSVVAPVRPYQDEGSVLPKDVHDAMHSSRLNSNVSFPHSILMTPVYEVPNDSESKIVAYIGGGFAWDYALRSLLPDNVNGIIVEIKNSCNQSSLYELVGHDAFYLGENATKESKYDIMEVVRDLSFGTHPEFASTPGHCLYTIVRYSSRWYYSIPGALSY
jgi:hypothetical protein